MKQLITILSLILLSITGFSKAVDITTAQSIAFNFYVSKSPITIDQLNLVYTSQSTIAGANTNIFYVFNLTTNPGFIIVSADDRVIPILAYSTESYFVNNKKNASFNYWINNFKRQITFVIEHNISATQYVSNKWNTLSKAPKSKNSERTTSTSVGPLLPTLWDQSNPSGSVLFYNAYCPDDNGPLVSPADSGMTVTGCVATAMGQVMKYWNWPDTGVGSVTYTQSPNPDGIPAQSANFAIAYHFDSMEVPSMTYFSPYIPRLIYNAGVSVYMDYGTDPEGGSGSYVTEAAAPYSNQCAEYALLNYWKYPYVQGYVRNGLGGPGGYPGFTDAQWIDSMLNEINSLRPIIYGGQDTSGQGGHCFVLDGYDDDTFFHFNWGWTGSSDCYTSINNLVPPGSGYVFDDQQQAILRIEPQCPTPTMPSIVSAPMTLCQGATSLYVFGASYTSSYTYSITGTGGWSGSSTTDSIYITAGTGIATVTVNALSSCGSTPNTFTIAAATTPPVPTIGAVMPACIGATSATYSASATYATTYSWTVSGAGWSGTSTSNILPLTMGTGSATLTCVASNACGTSTASTYIVTPYTSPNPSSAINVPSPLCSGSMIDVVTPLVANTTGYTWNVIGSGWSGSGTSDTCFVTVGTGPATITVSPLNGCGSATPYTITTIAPILPANVSFAIQTHTTDIIISDTFTFTGSAPEGSTYLWQFGAGSIPGSSSTAGPESVYWATGGLKTITLTTTDSGCSWVYADTVLVINNVGVANVNATNEKFNIVPNPNNGNFDIIFNDNVNKPFDVKIIDLNGKTVYSNLVNTVNNTTYPIKTTNLSPGNYNISIFIDGNVYTNKITIQK